MSRQDGARSQRRFINEGSIKGIEYAKTWYENGLKVCKIQKALQLDPNSIPKRKTAATDGFLKVIS